MKYTTYASIFGKIFLFIAPFGYLLTGFSEKKSKILYFF